MSPTMDRVVKLAVFGALLLLLGVPLALRRAPERVPEGGLRLVIVTPHNEQIRYEFGRAFSEWHKEKFGEPVNIDWRNPGGTSEIRRLLESQYVDAVSRGRLRPDGTLAPGAEPLAYDLFFGGGSYEHTQTKAGVSVTLPGEEKVVKVPLSTPAGFSQAQLDEWFGENAIGPDKLYDPEQYWIGNALSGFGIIYNRDVLRSLGIEEPYSFTHLAHPDVDGWVALADPRASGSVATLYDSILNRYGWKDGWAMLRAMGANARYFANSSPKVPIDVSNGEAAMGVAIDFYGRYQAQAVMRPGETAATSRVGYIDPPGEVYIDADPISLLAGGPNPDLARRFIAFTLTEKAQSLWQFPSHESLGGPPPDGLGPERYELRRMPVRRVMYERYADRMVDRIQPFEAASPTPSRGWRSAIGPMMGACSIDIHDEQVAAWRAMHRAIERGALPALVAEMEALFYAMPPHTMPDGTVLEFNEANYRAIRNEWREAGKEGRPSWDEMRLGYTMFFRDNYRRVVELAEELDAR